MFRFILTDLAGVALSELPGATVKRVAIPVLSMGTSSIVVPGDSEDADLLLGGDVLLRVYEVDDDDPADVTLLAHHRLVTAEEVGDENRVSVAAAFADPLWILTRRLIGKSAAGYTRGTSLSPVDRGTIIAELLAAANVEGVSGLRAGTITASSSTYVAGWFFKPLAEAIAELCATLDGPDWKVRPIEYSGGYFGELDVTPSIATVRPDAVFEYGEGLLNVKTFRRGVSLEGTLDRVFSLPSGFPDNAIGTVLQRDDVTAQAARGLLEGVVPGDLAVDAFRGSLLDLHLLVRAGPRQTITFDPVRATSAGIVPRLGRDFDVGDILPFRATIRRGLQAIKRLDILVRVYRVELVVDDAGAGTYTLTVTPS